MTLPACRGCRHWSAGNGCAPVGEDFACAGAEGGDRTFEPAYRLPFLIGVYLAVNAIPDAHVVVDGPDCLFFKAEFIHGRHDLRSTLLDVEGRHRIVPTLVDANSVAGSVGEEVAARIDRLEELGGAGLVIVTSLPMVQIIGTQYDRIVRERQPASRAKLVEVPGRSLGGDWVAGFQDVLTALARSVEVGAGTDPEGVSVIGHFMDRTEEDCRGNVRELRRLLGALGLRVDSVWLEAEPFARLEAAARSRTLVALPMGREAAAALAGRTGATVVEAEVPFGLERTADLLRAVGGATGRRREAEALVEGELRAAAPHLEWLVPLAFLERRVAFSGAPDLLGGFVQLAGDLGMEVVHLSSPARRPPWLEGGLRCTFAPALAFVTGQLQAMAPALDLVVCSSTVARHLPADLPVVEHGFPSHSDHALLDRPFLGFRGFLSFAERMANAVLRARRPHRPRGA